jgi:hypothetical protein
MQHEGEPTGGMFSESPREEPGDLTTGSGHRAFQWHVLAGNLQIALCHACSDRVGEIRVALCEDCTNRVGEAEVRLRSIELDRAEDITEEHIAGLAGWQLEEQAEYPVYRVTPRGLQVFVEWSLHLLNLPGVPTRATNPLLVGLWLVAEKLRSWGIDAHMLAAIAEAEGSAGQVTGHD